MLEWALQAATNKPCVERVMAVLDEHGALRESQKRTAGVPEFRRADQHRAIDVMALFRVWIDGCPAIDQRVEERERGVEGEPLRSKLQDQEGSVAGRLDVERDELGLFQPSQRPNLGCVDRDLLPRHQLHRATGLEVQRLRAHRASASARRAHPISSRPRARSSKTATMYTATPAQIGTAIKTPSMPRSGQTATPMTRPASKTRQLNDTTGTRPMWRAVSIQAATPSAISVATVAQLPPTKPTVVIRMRFSPTLTSRLQPAAHVKEDWRSDPTNAPINAVLMNAKPSARARMRKAVSDSGYSRKTSISG